MTRHRVLFFLIFIFAVFISASSCHCEQKKNGKYCYTGAFLSDNPAKKDINDFKRNFGKKPFLVMLFTDWGKYPDEKILEGIYSEGCEAVVTWEPWDPATKKGIDTEKFLAGGYDDYITSFAKKLSGIKGTVYVRFAHEMNGDWYPWSVNRIAPEKYAAMYRKAKDIFDSAGAKNAKWIFSVNWESVPANPKNEFDLYYPGPSYVDYIGIDGYNWGSTQEWSKWMSFKELFGKRTEELAKRTGKPVMITEFGCASKGGDKAVWIKEALEEIRKTDVIKAFVIFNVDKEGDWRFSPYEDCGRALKKALANGYFKGEK